MIAIVGEQPLSHQRQFLSLINQLPQADNGVPPHGTNPQPLVVAQTLPIGARQHLNHNHLR